MNPNENTAPRKVEVSHRSIVFTVLFLLFLAFLFFIRQIIFLFLLAFLLMLALHSSVVKMESWHIPRLAAIFINYIFLIGLIISAVGFLAGPLAQQSQLLVRQFSYLQNKFWFSQWFDALVKDPFARLGGLSGNVLRFTQGVVSNALRVFSVLAMNFYLMIERKRFPEYFDYLFNKKNSKKVKRILQRTEEDLGRWLWGELLLMLIVGVLVYLGLLLLGVKYAVPLAFLAGVLEIFPYIGPILSGIPGILIGFSMSPLMGVSAGLVYLLVQLLENNIIVPKVMQKTTGINPIITLMALLIGFRIAGIAGAIFSLPVVLIGRVMASELLMPRLRR